MESVKTFTGTDQFLLSQVELSEASLHGDDHVQILVDAQKSSKIMKDIAELIGKYPMLNDK